MEKIGLILKWQGAWWCKAQQAIRNVYLKNRSPHKAVKEEILTGPKDNTFKVFGSAAQAHVPKQLRHNWNPNSKSHSFCFYFTEANEYRLFDPKNLKINNE